MTGPQKRRRIAATRALAFLPHAKEPWNFYRSKGGAWNVVNADTGRTLFVVYEREECLRWMRFKGRLNVALAGEAAPFSAKEGVL